MSCFEFVSRVLVETNDGVGRHTSVIPEALALEA
jgi:hypothetical protein